MIKEKVVIAMSGGVDSSVAAALLVEAGYDVTGMMLRLWSEPGTEDANRCCTPDSMSLARRVAAILDIPFYVLDIREHFRNVVVEYFLDGYTQGVTPNPCLLCNKQIRFTTLLNHALALGASHLATGHYARLTTSADGKIELRRGLDRKKDQSYVLSVLSQDQLQKALFPIGNLLKEEVRALAAHFRLPVATRSDSQDLCFLAGQDYRDFLTRNSPVKILPGDILDTKGKKLGEHQGLPFYTIGQRKGLPIQSQVPMYVKEKDPLRNVLIVATREELGDTTIITRKVNWISGETPGSPLRAQVKIRYQSTEQWAWVIPTAPDSVKIDFDEPVRDATPGQAAVIYQEDLVLGSGIISQVE